MVDIVCFNYWTQPFSPINDELFDTQFLRYMTIYTIAHTP